MFQNLRFLTETVNKCHGRIYANAARRRHAESSSNPDPRDFIWRELDGPSIPAQFGASARVVRDCDGGRVRAAVLEIGGDSCRWAFRSVSRAEARAARATYSRQVRLRMKSTACCAWAAAWIRSLRSSRSFLR
jgi:hypothetical protein